MFLKVAFCLFLNPDYAGSLNMPRCASVKPEVAESVRFQKRLKTPDLSSVDRDPGGVVLRDLRTGEPQPGGDGA